MYRTMANRVERHNITSGMSSEIFGFLTAVLVCEGLELLLKAQDCNAP